MRNHATPRPSPKSQFTEAASILLVMVVSFPPILALAFWLRFDAPIWSAF